MSSGVSIGGTAEGAYITLLDTVSDTLSYVGKAAPQSATSAPVWQIKRIATTGTVLSITYASGSDSFNNVWDDRASLGYA